jgi:hypothetical protein
MSDSDEGRSVGRVDTIDRRTRNDRDVIVDLTPERFFYEQLPGLIEKHGHLAADGFQILRARPLTIEVGDFCRTLKSDDGTLTVVEGAVAGAVVVTLDRHQFSDWAQQIRSFEGMKSLQELRWRDGSDRQLAVWDSVWLAVLEGWPVVASDLDFVDRGGRPLDLARCFTPEDDAADIAHFLREAGYLHLRGWLDVSEMAAVSADMERVLPLYTEGDGRSWWATISDGTRRCVRMQYFLDHSPTTRAFLTSERWEHLRRAIAGDDELVQSPVEGNCVEALVKPLGVVKGVSDIPWHRDCTLGRHAYGCSSTTIGVSVTPGGETTGQLRVVAGSHRVNMPTVHAFGDSYLPVVPLPTETGDVTVHLSCTIHEAMPPMTIERKVMYTGFGFAPRPEDHVDHDKRRRDASDLRNRAAAVASQPPSPLARA